jgi:hypothetical protein
MTATHTRLSSNQGQTSTDPFVRRDGGASQDMTWDTHDPSIGPTVGSSAFLRFTITRVRKTKSRPRSGKRRLRRFRFLHRRSDPPRRARRNDPLGGWELHPGEPTPSTRRTPRPVTGSNGTARTIKTYNENRERSSPQQSTVTCQLLIFNSQRSKTEKPRAKLATMIYFLLSIHYCSSPRTDRRTV